MLDSMDIFIGADHRGFALKEQLKTWLTEQGHTVTDVGAEALVEGDDYPDYGVKVAQAVAEKPDERLGISICGSGAGMAIVADKIDGVRASLIHDPAIAQAARHDDNVNVLALGADYISLDQSKEVINAWLTTSFANEEKYTRRISKIHQYEQTN